MTVFLQDVVDLILTTLQYSYGIQPTMMISPSKVTGRQSLSPLPGPVTVPPLPSRPPLQSRQLLRTQPGYNARALQGIFDISLSPQSRPQRSGHTGELSLGHILIFPPVFKDIFPAERRKIFLNMKKYLIYR